MLLIDIIKFIKCKKFYNLKNNTKIRYIFSNSKDVKKFSIFIIDKNKKSNVMYIQEAIDNGANVILTNKYIKDINISQLLVKDIDLSISIILKKLKFFKPLNSLSITGTNGKTSVAWYVSQICFYNKVLTKTYGTLGYYINTRKKNFSNLTTPNFEVLYQSAFLKKKNFYNFIFEASSHSLHQERLKNFPINIAAITNITHDHLDYHKNFTNYKNSKYKLFSEYLSEDGYAILNDNIKKIDSLKKKLNNKRIITYGKKNSDVYITIENKNIKLNFFNKIFKIKLDVFSNIDLENLSCAIACCFCLNIKIKGILNSLGKISHPPGRLQKIKLENMNSEIYVDYAHTPDALQRILVDKTKKNTKPNVVFGCGGNRDKDKRSKMGRIANMYANRVYVTDDNPRDETPSLIRRSILDNCKRGIEIADRKKAIFIALKDLKKNEILIVAGKGHEKIQIYKNISKPFDDVKIIKSLIKEI